MRQTLITLILFAACAASVAQPEKRKPGPDQPASKQPAAQPAPEKPRIAAANSLGFIIQKGTEQGLSVREESRGWSIQDGEDKLKPPQTVGTNDLKLSITRFAPADDSVIVQVNVSPKDQPETILKALEGADKTKPVVLIDGKGRKYQPVGFVYKDPKLVHVRFTKGSPLKSLDEAPSVTRNNPDRELKLVFCVNLGVEVTELRIGDAVIERYSPPVKCDQKQK